jgi:hypothetical protein
MTLNRVTTLHYPVPPAKPVGTPPPIERLDEVRIEVILNGRRYGVKYLMGESWRQAYRPSLVLNSAIEKVSRSMQKHVNEMLRDA